MELEDWDEVVIVTKKVEVKLQPLPVLPTEQFYCELMKCTMAARHCPDRQYKKYYVNSTGEYRPDVRFLPCSSGKCVQGRKIMRQSWVKEYLDSLTKPDKKNDRVAF